MAKVTISTLGKMKAAGEKFVCVTAYDATFARIISEAGAETMLVGDSLGMVLQGHNSTIPVTMDHMSYHTECVCRAANGALVIADMPFMSYTNPDQAMANATRLMQAGAQMVKMEGGTWLSGTISKLVERGIPVCAHLGLTPQSVNTFGGYKVQGRTPKEAKSILADAVEAIIGALYLDSGYRTAEQFVLEIMNPQIELVLQNRHHKDYKTLLQEYCQKQYKSVPKYTLLKKTGPDHDRTFWVTVDLRGTVIGPESGKNKKAAEQAAASTAWKSLGLDTGS